MSSLSKKMIELYEAKNDGVYDIEKYLKALLKKELYNADLWLRLGIAQTLFPIADEDKALFYIDKLLKFDPNNYKALLIYAEIQNYTRGISQEIFNRLNNFKFPSVEYDSMAQYLISQYYYKEEDKYLEIEALERSVQLYQGHVSNNFRLGEYYYELGRKKDALLLFERARKNIVNIYESSQEHDFTDVDEYIAEFITGTCTTREHDIEQAILKCKNTL